MIDAKQFTVSYLANMTSLKHFVLLIFMCFIVFAASVPSSRSSRDVSQNENVAARISRKNPITFHLRKYDIRIDGLESMSYPDLKDIIRSQYVEDAEEGNIQGNQSFKSMAQDPIEKNVRIEHANKSAEEIENNDIYATLEDLRNKLDEIEKIRSSELKYDEAILETLKEITSLYNKTLQKSDGDLYLTKVGVSKPIITESSFKIESKEERRMRKMIPKNCLEVLEYGNNVSGVYQIQPDRLKEPFMVLCDMEIKGGGWTHIQKRFDGSVDFFLGWWEYKTGFGDLLGEFWIGLEHIRWLTGLTPSELLVEIVDRDNVTKYAHYKAFGIGTEPDGYGLDVLSGYSGDAGDSLEYHRGSKFTTKDFDQDNYVENCAVKYGGAWWFRNCFESNLNGKYINVPLTSVTAHEGLDWHTFRNSGYCHAKSRMLVKPGRS
ncbi:unnamed protein product [Phaedon cochleariae]|uniref:Fibrinogen C-terminal domain-containing protein n=1 Tax=Phaedon cochleariae TaxID=80249 RepID=A0A9P0DW66_PHACE|nr:unnamed protein product [Phaedon cochleariae]